MFKKALIHLAIRVLKKHLITRIEYLPVQKYLQAIVDKLEKLIDIITDKDPNNKAQFQQFWEEEKVSIFKETLEAASDVILAEVPDKEDAQLISSLLLTLIEEHEAEEEIPVK